MPGSKAATTLDERYSTDSDENSLYHRARECLRQLAKVRGKAAPTGVFYLEAFLRFGAKCAE